MSRRKSILFLLAAMLIFGTNGLLVAHIRLSSPQIVFFRTLFGGAALWLILLLKGDLPFSSLKKDILPLTVTGFCLGLNWILLFEAYRVMGVSLSTLIYYGGPLLVGVISPFLFHEKSAWNKWTALGIVALGVLLISGSVKGSEAGAKGLLLAFGAALSYASTVLSAKYVRHVSGLFCSASEILVAGILNAVYLCFTEGGLPAFPAGTELLCVLILGVVNTGLAYFLYFSSIRSLSGQSVGLCSYLDPASALLLSALFLHEKMTAVQILGAVLILGGAIFGEAELKKKRTE